MWEGILLGALLAGVAGGSLLCAEGNLAVADDDWSGTAVETTLKIYQSIPVSLNKALPAPSQSG